MGKGDKKTKRGKITKGTYGVRRPKSYNKKLIVDDIEEREKSAKKVEAKKKAPVKKEK